jgi:hypothetical protein
MSTQSILDGPAAKTPAQVAAQTIFDNAPAIYNGWVRDHNLIMNAVWNADGATPQQVADVLGTKAVSSMAVRVAFHNFILSINPAETRLIEVPAWATVTPNVDGTITITGTP